MSGKSKIEWTEQTWNPVVGCTKCSKGCDDCYAIRQAFRCAAMGIPQYQGLTVIQGGRPNWTGEVRLVEHKLDEPLHWRKPRTVFVNSMSDLFHEHLSDGDIIKVAEVMHKANWHTFQVLTKRHERMADLLNSQLQFCARDTHIWWGVSVENRKVGLPRIDHLRSADAAVRFLSVEPLLEDMCDLNLQGIHWVIVGGESGPRARDFDLGWARSIVRQCREQRVPCFVKQLGTRPFEDAIPIKFSDYKGGNPAEWPPDLRVREFPDGNEPQTRKDRAVATHRSGKITPKLKSIRSQQDPALAAQRRNAALKAWATRRAQARADAENKNGQMKKGQK